MTRIAYLGPPGTFTEAAARTLPQAAGGELQPRATITEALDAVRRGEADAAVVPVENSVEGSVNLTLDELGFGADDLVIVAEVLLPIDFVLLARPGIALADVTAVLSHPHATAQCRSWLAATLPGVAVEATASTADAARHIAGSEQPLAAIGAPVAAEDYALAVLAKDIADNQGAVTRFVLVRPGGSTLPAPTGADRTSAVAFIADDHPGALLELLEEFAVRGVNLSRIESRPTKAGLGRYCFFVDVEGHVAEPRVGEALSGLRRKCADVRFLGSYPRADGAPSPAPRGNAESDFEQAARWLAQIRGGAS